MSEWKEYKLSDLLEIIGGGTPKTNVAEYWNGNIPWLSVTDFNTGKKYCFKAEKNITEKGLKESSTKILKKGQIIISARGTVGVISMLGRDMAFNQSNYGINANPELTFNEYLYYLLKYNLSNFFQILMVLYLIQSQKKHSNKLMFRYLLLPSNNPSHPS